MGRVLIFLLLGLSFLFGGELLNLAQVNEYQFSNEKIYKKMVKMHPVEFPLAKQCSGYSEYKQTCEKLGTADERRVCLANAQAQDDIACEKLIEIYEPLCNEHNNGVACTSMSQLNSIFFWPHHGEEDPLKWGDDTKVVFYLKKACELGEKYGCQLLSYRYAPTDEHFKNRTFTENDAKKFFYFAKKSCTNLLGCEDAIDNLKWITEQKLLPVPKKDMQWFSEQAILEKSARAKEKQETNEALGL